MEQRNLTALPIPSARFYAQLLRSPPAPLRIAVAGGNAFLARSRLDQPPEHMLYFVAPKANLTGNAQRGFLDNSFIDAQYFTELGCDVLLADGHTSLRAAQASIENADPALSKLPTGIFLLDPQPADLIDYLRLSPAQRIAIGFSAQADLPQFLDNIQKLYSRGIRLLVLLPSRNQAEHDAMLSKIDPALRNQIFPPFKPLGTRAELSVHQQQLEAIQMFMGLPVP